LNESKKSTVSYKSERREYNKRDTHLHILVQLWAYGSIEY
jgi:hypothetical protein